MNLTNEKIGAFFNIAPASSPSYKRLGEGITNFTPSNNGQISTKHYINSKFATSNRNGLQKQWAISGDRAVGDPVNDYLVSLSEKTGDEVKTSIIIVELYKGVTSEGVTRYPAKKFDVMIDIGNDGTVEGGADVTIDGTVYAQGDPIEGVAVIGADDTATFTPTTVARCENVIVGINANNSDSVGVNMACETIGAAIKYTTDGTDPLTSGTASIYTTPLTLETEGVVTIKAVATKTGIANSDVVAVVAVVTA